ncbi:MAG: hypothetical protein ACOY32_08500 [Thermodesulfobacteriota bacterium]
MSSRSRWPFFLLLFLPLVLAGCAALSPEAPRSGPPLLYLPPDDPGLLARHAPLFVPQSLRQSHNRIGRPSLRSAGPGDEGDDAFVDPSQAIIYAESRRFATGRGHYTNLIYRIHFPAVPLAHLTAGRNSGLIVIVTLDADARPLLVTTVHTCGCYRAMVPTSLLDPAALPAGWEEAEPQRLWGENLPAILRYDDGDKGQPRLLVFLRDDTHRVMDLRFAGMSEVRRNFTTVPIGFAPMAALASLPRPEGGSGSFFEEEGWRKGYVKDSFKPWEMLLISWWALDFHVGCDKEYGDPSTSDTVFYTSLKPWNRLKSDMRDFAAFLAFWGWRL